MIREIEGDLLDFPEESNVILQCCNRQNKMGSGLALSIKERFPQAYEADTKAFQENLNQLSMFSVATLDGGNKIVNLYAQEHYGRDKRYLDYEALYSGLEKIKELLEKAVEEGRNYRLGIPYKLGSDRAGGNWNIVKVIIEEIFTNSHIDVVIVKKK